MFGAVGPNKLMLSVPDRGRHRAGRHGAARARRLAAPPQTAGTRVAGMTQTISASAPGPSPAVPAPGQPGSQPGKQPTAHGVGVGLILLGAFLLGFLAYLYGISSIQEGQGAVQCLRDAAG